MTGRHAARTAASAPACASCGVDLTHRDRWVVRTAGGVEVRCWRCALRHRPLLARSARVALLVGTLTALVNHGDALVGGGMLARGIAWKLPLAYVLPFVVASWGALANARRPLRIPGWSPDQER